MLVFVLASLSVFRVSRFVADDFLFESAKSWFLGLFDPDGGAHFYFDYLLSCVWCLSIWVSAVFTVLLLLTGFSVSVPLFFWLACSTVSGLLSDWVNRLD